MSEAKQSLARVVFEIKMKFSIEKSDEAKGDEAPPSRIFFLKKDEAFANKENLKTQKLIANTAIHSP